MSKGNSRRKVLQTAYGRIEKGWTQSAWFYYDPIEKKAYVCMEGAVVGYCNPQKHQLTKEQIEALDLLNEIIDEVTETDGLGIPNYNDTRGRTQDECLGIVKRALIRDEIEALMKDGLDADDADDLLAFKDNMSNE